MKEGSVFGLARELCDCEETSRPFDALLAFVDVHPEIKSRVYFLQAVNGGPIKIGFSNFRNGPRERCRDLQAGNPVPLVVVAAIPGTAETERELHRILAADRLEGEWFAFSPDLKLVIELVRNHTETIAAYESWLLDLLEEADEFGEDGFDG